MLPGDRTGKTWSKVLFSPCLSASQQRFDHRPVPRCGHCNVGEIGDRGLRSFIVYIAETLGNSGNSQPSSSGEKYERELPPSRVSPGPRGRETVPAGSCTEVNRRCVSNLVGHTLLRIEASLVCDSLFSSEGGLWISLPGELTGRLRSKGVGLNWSRGRRRFSALRQRRMWSA